jgi:TonB family protein
MPSRRKSWVARTVGAAIVALALHAVVLGIAALLGLFDALTSLERAAAPPPPSGAETVAQQADDDRPMQIESLVDELQKPDERTEEEKRREEQAKKEEEDKKPPGQVVDIAKPIIEQRPDKASYVAEHDSTVDRETKGPAGRDQAGAPTQAEPPPGLPTTSPPQPAVPAQPDKRAARPGRPGPLAMRELPPKVEKVEEGPAPTPDGELERAGSHPLRRPHLEPTPQAGEMGQMGTRADATPSQRPVTPQGETAPPGLPTTKPNLAATRDMLDRAIGKGSGSMDYLKDVDDGESTALNAKKWKHAPFFNRVKRAVAAAWHPDVVYVRHDPNGNVYGVKDRVTVLRVHLHPDGKLASWTVMQSSGVDFLDDEAVDAFRRAAPFPNPPRDLVETDGQIHFNFAFIFELSGRNSVKVFKY